MEDAVKELEAMIKKLEWEVITIGSGAIYKQTKEQREKELRKATTLNAYKECLAMMKKHQK